MSVPRISPTSEPPPDSASSAVKRVFIKYIDTLAALLITLIIFGVAYFLRIQPQLETLDMQMTAVSGQIASMNTNIETLSTHELVQLRLTTQALQGRMAELSTQATAVGGELRQAALIAPDLRKSLALYAASVTGADASLRELRATVRALDARLSEVQERLGTKDKKDFPPLYKRAADLAARLDRIEAAMGKAGAFPDLLTRAEKLAAKLETLQAQIDGKKRPFPDVRAEAQALSEALSALKAQAAAGMVACGDVRDKALLRSLRKSGYCK